MGRLVQKNDIKIEHKYDFIGLCNAATNYGQSCDLCTVRIYKNQVMGTLKGELKRT